jgi:hypothetical protein
MDAEARLVRNGETSRPGEVTAENATGTGIEIRRLDDGTIEIARCCIRLPKPAA